MRISLETSAPSYGDNVLRVELGARVAGSLNLENAYTPAWHKVEIRHRALAATEPNYVLDLKRKQDERRLGH